MTITDVFNVPVYSRDTGLPIGHEPYVSVKRNTSRRKQAIKVSTLRAKYRRVG